MTPEKQTALAALERLEKTFDALMSNPAKPKIFGLPLMDFSAIRAALSSTEAPQDGEVREAISEGRWVHVKTVEEMSNFYMSRLPYIREVAKDHGYAIGLHGSTRRDFDLIAMPWRDNPSDKDVLAGAIQKAACGFHHEVYQWEEKPCGRVATSFPICWTEWNDMISGGHIDLSLIRAATAPSADLGRVRGLLEKARLNLSAARSGMIVVKGLHPSTVSNSSYELAVTASEQVNEAIALLTPKPPARVNDEMEGE